MLQLKCALRFVSFVFFLTIAPLRLLAIYAVPSLKSYVHAPVCVSLALSPLLRLFWYQESTRFL